MRVDIIFGRRGRRRETTIERKKVEERKKMRMSEVVRSVSKKEFPPNQLFIIFELIANDIDTDEEVEIPYVKFRFR